MRKLALPQSENAYVLKQTDRQGGGRWKGEGTDNPFIKKARREKVAKKLEENLWGGIDSVYAYYSRYHNDTRPANLIDPGNKLSRQY